MLMRKCKQMTSAETRLKFDVLTSDRDPEVRTAAYGPEIDQSQHAKLVSHIIEYSIYSNKRPTSKRHPASNKRYQLVNTW